jgi:hypothetical protein
MNIDPLFWLDIHRKETPRRRISVTASLNEKSTESIRVVVRLLDRYYKTT